MLRIGFDLDGVVADMETELVRQAEILFGEAMTRKLQVRAADKPADRPTETPTTMRDRDPDSPFDKLTTSAGHAESTASAQTAAEAAPDNAPALHKLNMTTRQQRKLWRHVESIENFWQTLAECEPGAIARLAALASDRRWEIIFLTKRPESAGAIAQVQSQRWLESKGFPLPSLYVVQGSRGRIAAALGLDIIVDDRPENCLDVVVDSKARAILVWRENETQLPVAARRLGIGVVNSVGACLDILTQIDDSREDPGMMTKVMRLLGLKEAATAGQA